MRDDTTVQHLTWVVVVGSSCSGKTTFARELAAILNFPHVELDALHWGPGWVPKAASEFAHLTEIATAAPRWVVDGNYRIVREIVWPRATSIVWLNLDFATVFARAIRRTLRRSISGEQLYAGNRESLGRALLSRDSILLWVLQTYGLRRREFQTLKHGAQDHRWLEFRRQSEASAFLQSIRHAG